MSLNDGNIPAMLLDQVRRCMARALELEPAVAVAISDQTTAADLPKWTSVTHLSLVLELETTFGVTFDNNEIASLGSVAAILQRLTQKGVRSNDS